MGLIHLLAYGLIIAFLQSITYSKYTILFSKNEVCASVVFHSYLILNLFQLLPRTITQCLKMRFWMFGGYVFYYILATIAAVIIW